MYNQISLPSSQRANSPNINIRTSFDVDRYVDDDDDDYAVNSGTFGFPLHTRVY